MSLQYGFIRSSNHRWPVCEQAAAQMVGQRVTDDGGNRHRRDENWLEVRRDHRHDHRLIDGAGLEIRRETVVVGFM